MTSSKANFDNMSPHELKNMTKLMKDPKFMELFADYAKEISDPKNRSEMEDALRVAESRGEKVPGFPDGKELLIPTSFFCAKTRNLKTGAKVFINICYSDKIAKSKGTEAADKSGTAWEIPYSLGPARTDSDRNEVACEVHDFVVGTDTHEKARTDRRFQNFLVQTAIDAIQKQRAVQLSPDFILPKLKYKGPDKEPKMLTITKGPYKPAPANSPPIKEGEERLSHFTKTASTKGIASSVGKTGILGGTNTRRDSDSYAAPKEMVNTPARCDQSCEVSGEEVEPKYEVVYRNQLNFTNFWDDTANLPNERDKQSDIVLRVELPNVISMNDIQLKVTKQGVHLVVPGKYNLQVKLTHRVDDDKGQAKFERAKQQLQITLPICDPSKEKPMLH